MQRSRLVHALNPDWFIAWNELFHRVKQSVSWGETKSANPF